MWRIQARSAKRLVELATPLPHHWHYLKTRRHLKLALNTASNKTAISTNGSKHAHSGSAIVVLQAHNIIFT
jgi:hypothetical protein